GVTGAGAADRSWAAAVNGAATSAAMTGTKRNEVLMSGSGESDRRTRTPRRSSVGVPAAAHETYVLAGRASTCGGLRAARGGPARRERRAAEGLVGSGVWC